VQPASTGQGSLQVGNPVPPAPPQIFIDTAFQLPTGRVMLVHPGENLQAALDNAALNSVIVLDSGGTYTGQFVLKPKAGEGWLYIVSSAFLGGASVTPRHPEGTRVTAADAPDMAKLVSDRMPPPIGVRNDSIISHVRLVGLEITSSSVANADPNAKPWPVNGQTPVLVSLTQADNIVVDRCYIHGTDTVDVNHAVMGNKGSSYISVVDSEISNVHYMGLEAHGILFTASPGPFKIVNNKISATTEDVLFGGSGVNLPAPYNGMVPSDIEIRYNWFYKPESWIPETTTKPTRYTEKNNLEFKSGQRAIVEGNTMENAWWGGQYGSNILLTPRSYQSGPNTVVNDIDIEGNLLKNANWAFSISGRDELCQPPQCTNQGESARVRIAFNMIKLRSVASPASYKPLAFSIGKREKDYLIYSNTVVSMDNSAPWSTIYFNQGKCPLVDDQPVNMWIVDNVFAQGITGDCGYTGQKALDSYMPLPSPPNDRYLGNNVK